MSNKKYPVGMMLNVIKHDLTVSDDYISYACDLYIESRKQIESILREVEVTSLSTADEFLDASMELMPLKKSRHSLTDYLSDLVKMANEGKKGRLAGVELREKLLNQKTLQK
jgi:hypothetical protein